jgi:hypothetical protein
VGTSGCSVDAGQEFLGGGVEGPVDEEAEREEVKQVEKRVQERRQLEHGEKRPKILLDQVVALDGVARPERGVDLRQLGAYVGRRPGLPADPRRSVEVDVVEGLGEDDVHEGREAVPHGRVFLWFGMKGQNLATGSLQRGGGEKIKLF